MFVEIVRMFTVVLVTAIGFMTARDFGAPPKLSGLFGIVACLVGYLVGGFLGRLLERAVGVAERRADRVPIPQLIAGILGGALGGMIGLAIAIVLMAVAANYIAKLLATYPWISWVGLAIIVYVAIQMCWTGIHDIACMYVPAETCQAGLISTVRTLMSATP